MTRTVAVAVLALAVTTSCSLVGGDSSSDTATDAKSVVLVTHESFALPDDLVAKFEKESGYQLKPKSSGDAGALTNKLVLTKDSPTGDVAFGVDNTFASRAVDEGVFAEYAAELPAGAEDYALEGDGADRLTPIDRGGVCVNVDTAWFKKRKLAAPTTLDDLADPAYKDLFVLPGAPTSSPGMAFLLTTIDEYGEDGWQDYWTRLLDNGAKLTAGWTDAYQGEFTQGGGKGKRPIVLSYDSSPAFTVSEDGSTSTTEALLSTCFEQVEYAGVLAKAKNPKGAQALIDFLLTDEVQEALPDSMYVFPVAKDAALPATWRTFAKQPIDPHTVDPDTVADKRDDWLTEWTDITTR